MIQKIIIVCLSLIITLEIQIEENLLDQKYYYNAFKIFLNVEMPPVVMLIHILSRRSRGLTRSSNYFSYCFDFEKSDKTHLIKMVL